MDYYLLENGQRIGPLSLDQLRAKKIATATPVWKAGYTDWQSADQLPELQVLWNPAALAATPQPSSAPTKSEPHVLQPGIATPWNPFAIFWLGFVFSPIWSGVMAALNEQRLQSGKSIAPPLWIGGIWMLCEFVLSPWFGWGMAMTIVCWIVAQVLILGSMDAQIKLFESLPQKNSQQDYYVIPCLAGAPAALLLMYAVFSYATAIPQPYDVCRSYLGGNKAEKQKLSDARMQTLDQRIEGFVTQGGTFKLELSKEVQEAYPIPGDKFLIPATLSYSNHYARPVSTAMPVYFQLIMEKERFVLDDIVYQPSNDTTNGMVLISLYQNQEQDLAYTPRPANARTASPTTAATRSPTTNSVTLTSSKKSTIPASLAVPAAVAGKALLPSLGKGLVAVIIAVIALLKGISTVGQKRGEAV